MTTCHMMNDMPSVQASYNQVHEQMESVERNHAMLEYSLYENNVFCNGVSKIIMHEFDTYSQKLQIMICLQWSYSDLCKAASCFRDPMQTAYYPLKKYILFSFVFA